MGSRLFYQVLSIFAVIPFVIQCGIGSKFTDTGAQNIAKSASPLILSKEIDQRKILFIAKLSVTDSLSVHRKQADGSWQDVLVKGSDLQVLAVRSRFCFIVTDQDAGLGAKELFFVKGSACNSDNLRKFNVNRIEKIISKGRYLWFASIYEKGTIELDDAEIGKIDITYPESKKNVGAVYGLCQDFSPSGANIPTSFYDECDITLDNATGVWALDIAMKPRFSKAKALETFQTYLKTHPTIPVYNATDSLMLISDPIGIYRRGVSHSYSIWYHQVSPTYGACSLRIDIGIGKSENEMDYEYTMKNLENLFWVCEKLI